ncbi:MAG: hypothetical protein OXC44_04580 [Proteobacteria bacterium]|nr:hypothetical protein [Pseudomonadota bacterium]
MHYCVDEDWDNRWVVWHIIRPFVGAACGVISLLFIKAGLILLATSYGEPVPYGVYVLSLISGFNIDNFLKKIESIINEVFGIKETRQSQKPSKKEQ